MEKLPKTLPKGIINLFFILGLVSAVLFRIVVIASRFNPLWGRILWYCGVCGYIFFFGYRFYISRKRRKTIQDNDLIEQALQSNLPEPAKSEILYILKSIIKSKEMINYVFIFIMSGITVTADILLSVLMK